MSSLDIKSVRAIITAGGLGTRLLPFSKEIPKEMSPIITRNGGGQIEVKPIIQAIYEQLFQEGVRDFSLVVGRGKRAIQDHFTVDTAFVEALAKSGKPSNGLGSFYQKIRSSNLAFVSQPEPLGFGDAVLRAKPYVNGTFLVHAGDTFILSTGHIERLLEAHRRYKPDATILLQDVADPRQYGVVVGEDSDGSVRILEAEEKPEKPKSHMAIMPVYLFEPTVFSRLEKAKPGKSGEIQLTDAIHSLCLKGKVMGVKLLKSEVRLDIGSPETLLEALELSRKHLGE